MNIISFLLLLIISNILCSADDNLPVIYEDTSYCSCLEQKPSINEECVNGHGTVIAYFRDKTNKDEYTRKYSNGFMDDEGAVTTTAHSVVTVLHARADSPEITQKNKNFLKHYKEICYEAYFFSRDGECYALGTPYIPSAYFEDTIGYMNNDIAILQCTSSENFQSLTQTTFHTNEPIEQNQTVVGNLYVYTYYQNLFNQTIRTKHYLTGNCTVSEYTTVLYMPTQPGMSGGNVFFKEAPDRHQLIAVHRSTDPETKEHKAVTLNLNIQKELQCGHHVLLKRKLWLDYGIDQYEASNIVESDPWHPVLFSIQADNDVLLQMAFLHKLKGQLISKLSARDCIASEVIPQLFDYFSFSGKGKEAFETVFLSEQSPMFTREQFERKIIIDKNPPNLAQDNTLFVPPISSDVTDEGLEKLKTLEQPLFILSLGISHNTNAIHKDIVRYTDQGDLYHRLNYLYFNEKDQSDYINLLAENLIANYLKKPHTL